ncbi:hypothetical protein DTO164E3_9215 [Paecilomyces variotii]|nr:hypothetical protein DTO164E3_9215 [Paecilomyces variotii]
MTPPRGRHADRSRDLAGHACTDSLPVRPLPGATPRGTPPPALTVLTRNDPLPGKTFNCNSPSPVRPLPGVPPPGARVPGSRAREPLPGGTPAPRPLCLPAPPASPRTVPPKADSSRPIVNWRRPTPRQSLSPPSPRPGPPAGCPGGPPAPGATARSSPPASPYGPVTGRRGTSFPPSTLPGCDRDRLRSRAGPLPACPETAGSLPPAVAPGHSSFLIDSPTSIELGSCVQRFPCPKVAAGERFCMGKTHHMGHFPPYKVGHFVRAAKALDRVGQQLADPGSLQRWSVRG